MTTPPHSPEIERALLGCCLADGAASVFACEVAGINSDCFHVVAHSTLWTCLAIMAHANSPIDTITVCEELERQEKLERVGGFAGLSAFTSAIATTAHRSDFAERLLEQAWFRGMLAPGTALVEAAGNQNREDVEAAMARIATAAAPRRKARSLAEVAEEEERKIGEELAGKLVRGIVGWGLPKVDRYFGLLRRGELACVAARPGVGKTSLCLSAAVRAAIDGRHVVFFSLEMPTGDLLRIAAGQLSGLSPRDLYRATKDELIEFGMALRKIGRLTTLHVFDADRTTEQVSSRVRAMHLTGKVDAVYIDYLQRLAPPKGDHQATRDQRIGAMTTALKGLALDTQTAVVIAAQVGRAAESEEREPRMSDLRESGNIEADCDRVYFIHRPLRDMSNIEQGRDADRPHVRIIVDKNRGGPTGPVWCRMDRPTQTFTEITTREDVDLP